MPLSWSCAEFLLMVAFADAGGQEFSIPDGLYSSDDLKKPTLPDGVDPSTKEQWLSDDEGMRCWSLLKLIRPRKNRQ